MCGLPIADGEPGVSGGGEEALPARVPLQCRGVGRRALAQPLVPTDVPHLYVARRYVTETTQQHMCSRVKEWLLTSSCHVKLSRGSLAVIFRSSYLCASVE